MRLKNVEASRRLQAALEILILKAGFVHPICNLLHAFSLQLYYLIPMLSALVSQPSFLSVV